MKKTIEKRRSSRQKTFLIGKVGAFEVVVVDMSAGGARLFLDASKELPSQFDLRIKRRKTIYRCELIRRTGETAGVRFLSQQNAEGA